MLEMPPFRGAGLTVYRIVPVILASLTVWRIFIRSAFRRFQRRKAFFTTSNILTSFLPLLTLRFSLSAVYNITYLIGYASSNPKKKCKKNAAHDFVDGGCKKNQDGTATLLVFIVSLLLHTLYSTPPANRNTHARQSNEAPTFQYKPQPSALLHRNR